VHGRVLVPSKVVLYVLAALAPQHHRRTAQERRHAAGAAPNDERHLVEESPSPLEDRERFRGLRGCGYKSHSVGLPFLDGALVTTIHLPPTQSRLHQRFGIWKLLRASLSPRPPLPSSSPLHSSHSTPSPGMMAMLYLAALLLAAGQRRRCRRWSERRRRRPLLRWGGGHGAHVAVVQRRHRRQVARRHLRFAAVEEGESVSREREGVISQSKASAYTRGACSSAESNLPAAERRQRMGSPIRHFKIQPCCCLGSAFEVAGAFQTPKLDAPSAPALHDVPRGRSTPGLS
jgi:hypothetical protein